MVLKRQGIEMRSTFNIIIPLLMISMLNACSHLGSQTTQNSSPIKPVIAVPDKNTEATPPANTKRLEADTKHQQTRSRLSTEPSSSSTTSPAQIINSLADSQQPDRPEIQLAPTDVLGSIMTSAKKAVSRQQWLRAQRHLEHALRVAPKDAEIYYIYAAVYEGLGVKAQTIHMLKRAKFLARPNSDIYRSASQKLDQLSTAKPSD